MKDKVLKISDFLTDFSIISILFLLPVFFSFIYETWNIFELPKVVAFRYLLAIGVISWLASSFIRGYFKHRISRALFGLVSLFFLSSLAATIFSIHPQLSFWGEYQRLQGFSSFLSYVVFFWLCILHLDSWRKIKMCIWSIVASSAFVCFYGTSQFLYSDPMRWAESFENFRRIFSSLGQPNFLGHYLIIVMPITAYSFLFMSKRAIPRLLLFLLLLLQTICLYYTWSRSAWLAFAAEIWIGTLLFLAINNFKRLFKTILISSIAVVLVLGVFLAIPKNNDFWLRNRWLSSFDLSVGSQRMRLLYISKAANEYQHTTLLRKAFGYGQDVLSDVTVKWYDKEWGDYEKINTWPDRIHNFFFDTLLTSGAFGILSSFSLAAYFIYLTFSFLRRHKHDKRYWLQVFLSMSVFGYFINNLFSFSVTPQYVYFYFIIALSFVNFFSDRLSKEIEWRIGKTSKILLMLALAFFFGVFVFYKGARAMRADYYFAAARDLGASKVCQALGFNRLASIIDPDENFYREEYLFNALNCFDSIEEEEQKDVLKENIDIVLSDIPKKERWYFIKLEEANILSAYAVNIDPSYAASAEDSFKGLIEEYPNISQVYLYYSYHKLRMKEYSEVPELTSKAESLMPKLTLPLYFLNMIHRQSLASELVRVHEMTAVSYESRGEYGKAAEYYEKAIKANPYRFADYKRLADMYYFQGDIDTAIKYNQRGYSMNKNDFSWPLSIALLLKEKGDEEGAVDYARQALNIDPENKEASDIVSEYKEEK